MEQDISNVLDHDGVLHVDSVANSFLEVCTQATVEENELLQTGEQLLHLVGCQDVLSLQGNLVHLRGQSSGQEWKIGNTYAVELIQNEHT